MARQVAARSDCGSVGFKLEVQVEAVVSDSVAVAFGSWSSGLAAAAAAACDRIDETVAIG